MAVERKGFNCFRFTCDECGNDDLVEPEHGGDGSFAEAWAGLKADGWRTFKDGRVWVHKCPECVQEWARNKRATERAGEAKANREAIAALRDRTRQRTRHQERNPHRPEPADPNERPPWDD